MPYALSQDGGHTWAAKRSSFTGIHGGEREVMIRLGSIDQPLMHCTFANGPPAYAVTLIPDAKGVSRTSLCLLCRVNGLRSDAYRANSR